MISSHTSVKPALCIAAAVVAAPAMAQGAVLASYTFGSGTTSTSAPSTDTDTHTLASSFTNGPGIDGTFTSGSAGTPAGSRGVFTDRTASTEVGAVTNNDFYTFTLTPNAGQQVTYASLTFDIASRRGAASAPASNTATFFVRSDAEATDFSTTLGSGSTTTATSVQTGQVPFTAVTVPLTSLGTISTAVTFRIYVYDNTNESSTINNLIDSVTLNGNASAIPEPASLALLALGGMMIASRRRA